MKFISTFIFLTICCVSISNAQDLWTQKSNFPGVGREAAVAFSVADKGYVGTGFDGGSVTPGFWEYDPATDTWTQKANSFVGLDRYGAVAFTILNKGYIGTGQNIGPCMRDFWEYDPALNVWAQKADLPGAGRTYATGFSVGSKGYLGLGVDSINECLLDFWEYDPTLDQWNQKTNFPGLGRMYSVGFSINSKGYIGCGADSVADNCYQDFWEYNPTSDTWTQKADFAGDSRYGSIVFSIGLKGYVGTGDFCLISGITTDFWEYNQSTDLWTQKANLVTPGNNYSFAVGFEAGGKGYITTGVENANFTQELWEYTPDTIISICHAAYTLLPNTVPNNWVAVNNSTGTAPINYTWDWGDGSTSIGATPSHIYADSGYYNICLSITDGASQTDNYCDSTNLYRVSANATMVSIQIINPTTIGIQQQSIVKKSFKVFPNPANNIITIEGMSDVPFYEIRDITGRCIMKIDNHKEKVEVDIQKLNSGIYFIFSKYNQECQVFSKY